MLESDPDWVPSLHLGHGEGNGRRSERFPPSEQSKVERRQRWTTKRRHEARTTHRERGGGGGTQDSLQTTGAARPTAPPWREVKSLLQSVLQSKTNETDESAAAKRKKTELSFRDFFRDALEASLEASSRSRAWSQRPPSVSEEYTVELNFTQNQTSSSSPSSSPFSSSSSPSPSSSSSCLNCRRLQRRITELEEKLCNLEGEQEDMQTSPVASRAEVRQNQVLQSPEPVHKAEDETGWMEPLSPPHESDEDVDSVSDSASDSTPSSPGVFQIVWSKQRRRLPPRFNKAWLKTFWFLRYSPDLDLMWCHVCRLHADKRHQNMALIKGSKMFKLDNIKKHRDSRYHKENMERHMLDVYELQQ
ncbi:uncharacterized protein LOC108872625 isoform X2 [Lates calcarifer]|nr:uncharacterized protein LOC108872625 isoform X2 [Lates calcarifer]XP_050929061.1 uncharacterized protein LOC108872625 isoform X2 [Lates calcarifer]XP_050929062.1 uncharacterized protein LOC108872625 isoform X2 [Lates calcarifer]